MMVEIDYAKKMQKCHEYVEALEEEQKKIQVFQRELPLCLELVTQAIEACRKELSGTTTTSEQCSEQTTSVCGGPVFEEFIPIKKRSLCEEEEDGEHESSPELEQIGNNKKSDWLRSVQLWTPSPDPNPKEERVVKKAKVVEVKPKSGAFQPFQKEKKRVLETDLQPAVKVACSTPATTTSSTTETGGGKSELVKVGEEKRQIEQQQSQSQTHRKQRRCWSPELHRRFLNALQQLGGSHVATPKQIRDHMKVDGLTNDEVKSHLQKYRLHTRRPAAASVAAQSNGNPQQPQFVVVGGIWVPSPQDFPPPSDVANKGGVYAPVAVAQSPKRSVERSCNSPAASSSTNTNTSTPVS
ncbi:Homeobox-like domain superfamily [Arabidopsis thaliana x Arabidopsis arenosa]|uniref:Homeobox-like domain superfamily n=1 Tax=Arabidopsis thaliana x Arabidopsis arenosa TaxID=1240361 RepID=A0A8T2BKE4_9BRAS|nr:Homeobox-like domain superfamily [Arabidopsis thaliana x Arabidopsis arenosa]